MKICDWGAPGNISQNRILGNAPACPPYRSLMLNDICFKAVVTAQLQASPEQPVHSKYHLAPVSKQ